MPVVRNMSTSYPATQRATPRPPVSIPVAGVCLIIAGILAFVNSYLILASSIFWGWLILDFIGVGALVCGAALLEGFQWGYDGAGTIAVLMLIVGIIAVLGAFNIRFQILGWVGLGTAIGGAMIVLSALALIFLYRPQSRYYFEEY